MPVGFLGKMLAGKFANPPPHVLRNFDSANNPRQLFFDVATAYAHTGIEKLWSKVKSWLRRSGAREMDAFIKAIGDAFRRVEHSKCSNYFSSCGYAIDDR